MMGVVAVPRLSAMAEAMSQTYLAFAVVDLFQYRLCAEV
jgi:hypothetical protein